MFPTTNWTRLAVATMEGQSAGREALAALCRDYRPAIVGHLRGRGFPEAEAEDLAQQFFVSLLNSRAWRRADRAKGRFRSFLLGILEHVIAHRREQGRAQKRGGGVVPLSLDALAEEGFDLPEAPTDAARLFDREWALRMVELALAAIEAQWAAGGKADEFAVLRGFLPGAEDPPTYEAAAARLQLSPAAVKSAIHRLRRAFRAQLRSAVARTVSLHEIDAELAHLRRVLEG